MKLSRKSEALDGDQGDSAEPSSRGVTVTHLRAQLRMRFNPRSQHGDYSRRENRTVEMPPGPCREFRCQRMSNRSPSDCGGIAAGIGVPGLGSGVTQPLGSIVKPK
jgi:hypothetical protein